MTSDLPLSPPSLQCLPALLLACSGTTLDQNKPGHQPPSPPDYLPLCLTTARYFCHHHHHHQNTSHHQYHRRVSFSLSLVLAPPSPIYSVLESTRMSLSISPQSNLVSSTSTQSASGPLDLLTFVFAPARSHSITVHA